ISTGDNDQAWRGSPALTEPSRITGLERLRHLLAFHLANDQPGGRGGERQADMLMAVAAIDVGQPRRAADGRTKVGQGRPLADPAAALLAADAREDVLEMPHQEIGTMPGWRLMWRGQLDGAGESQPFLHGCDEEAAAG